MLFLITGWATDQTIWPKWLKQLAVEHDETDFFEYSSLEKVFLKCWQEKQEQMSILGWSLGGMLALELALKHSDKIKQRQYKCRIPGQCVKTKERRLEKLLQEGRFYYGLENKKEKKLKIYCKPVNQVVYSSKPVY